jgi:hypothetical protein
MKKQILSVFLILAAAIFSCEYPYFLVITGVTIQHIHVADSAYYSKSNKTVLFNTSKKQLEFAVDTMRLIIDGVIQEVVYIKSRDWVGKKKNGTQILTGINSFRKSKSIRVTLKNIEKRGNRMFITSEIMDGEYNAAADTIWTYYKPLPD